jgi:hypothetical protein
MRRLFGVALALALMMLLAVGSVAAASPHFKKGGSPVCTVSGSGTSQTVNCTGSLSGLGNGDLLIETTIGGFALYVCQNAGGNSAPGQNKVLEGPQTVPTLIPSDSIKNGNVTFTTNDNTLTAAPTVSGAAAGCPNANWTGVNPTLTITSIRLTIAQGGVTLFTCTASSSGGLTGRVALSC